MYKITCKNSHVLIHKYEFVCQKLKPVSIVVLVLPEAFGSPEVKNRDPEAKSRSGSKIARNQTASKIAHSQTIIFI
jgi:hypothetical protein